MADAMDQETLKNTVETMGAKYKGIMEDLQKARATVAEKERTALVTLQQLTPLQNMYFSRIINTLQQQVKELQMNNTKRLETVPEEPSEPKSPTPVPTPRARSRKNNVEATPPAV